MRREDEGNQVQAREIRESDLVAVPIRAPAGDADIRTGDDASSPDAAIHRASRRHKLSDDPVGATAAHLLEQVESVAALDVEQIETGQVLGKIPAPACRRDPGSRTGTIRCRNARNCYFCCLSGMATISACRTSRSASIFEPNRSAAARSGSSARWA
jgi:hypothetical protein